MNQEAFKILLPKKMSEYMSACKGIKYEPKGISNFEGLCLWTLADLCKPQIIIESGVSKARSTEILCQIARNFESDHVYAFEKSPDFEAYVRQKLKKYSNVTYEIGDSCEKVSSLIASVKNKRVGAFIDGPKKGKAYNLLMKNLSLFPQMEFVVTHDCYIGSPTREAFLEGYRNYFSDKYDLFFTEQSTFPDRSINTSLLQEMSKTHPDKMHALDDNCYRIGIITRKSL